MILCKNCDQRHPGCHDTCPIHKAELAEDHAKKAYLAKYKTMYGSIDNERGRKVRKALRKHGKRA